MEKFIFIDRDGVINRDPDDQRESRRDELTDKRYVTCWEEFQFLPGSLEALKQLTENDFRITIISNQAGVAKGVYTKEALDDITKNMLEAIEKEGARIYSVQYCTHRDEDNCDCRKPRTGLFKKAAQGAKIDFTKSYFIGDTKRDIEAGKRIGCKTILVLSGKVKDKNEVVNWEVKPDIINKSLKEAVEFIVKNKIKA